MCVNICLDLLPELRASASPAETDAFNRNVDLVEDREGIFQAVGYAFDDCADQMRASVRRGETDKSGAREWIEVRSALAHQVGRPENAFGACWNRGGFCGEAFIRIAAVVGACAKTIAEPAEREACGFSHPHDVPTAGDGVTESVEAASGIERGAICSGKNHAGSSDGGADDSGACNSHANRTGSLIACACHNRCSCVKTAYVCSRFRKLAANFLRFVKFWKVLYVDACFGEHFARPNAVRDVEQQRAGSVGHVNGRFAGEAQPHVVLRQHDFADTLPIFGLILPDPKKFGEREVC